MLPGFDVASGWNQWLASGGTAPSLLELAMGAEVGRVATGSSLACALGAAALVVGARITWQVAAGGAVSLLLTAALCHGLSNDSALTALPAVGHLLVGNVAFVLAFVLTDPTLVPLTRAGRWACGALFGAVTVVVRLFDPSHPEAALFAALLAMLSIPLFDWLAIRGLAARWGSV